MFYFYVYICLQVQRCACFVYVQTNRRKGLIYLKLAIYLKQNMHYGSIILQKCIIFVHVLSQSVVVMTGCKVIKPACPGEIHLHKDNWEYREIS